MGTLYRQHWRVLVRIGTMLKPMLQSHVDSVVLMLITALFAPPTLISQNAPSPIPASQADVPLSVSGNPAAVQDSTGSGTLQALVLKRMGIEDNHGIFFGGLWLGDCNWL